MSKEKLSDKERAKIALDIILSKVDAGTASMADIKAAMKLNELFLDGAFSASVEAAARSVEAKISAENMAKANPTADAIVKPYAAVAAADKFYDSEEMRRVLAVQEKMAKEQPLTKDELVQSTQTIFDKKDERSAIRDGLNARKAKITAEIKTDPTTLPKHKKEINSIFDNLERVDRDDAQEQVARRMMKEHKMSFDDIAATMPGVFTKEVMETVNAGKNVSNSQYREMTGEERNPPAKEAERQQQRTNPSSGTKRKASAMDADEPPGSITRTMQETSPVQKVDRSTPLTPDPTPRKSDDSRQTGKPSGTIR